MPHAASPDDEAFRADFENLAYPPQNFHHKQHLQLAYVYLTEHDIDCAHALMRRALLAFIRLHAGDPAKYHETITRAWILAVRHFMARTPACASFDELIAANPIMLDSKIMLTHYSAELLYSENARVSFVEPNLHPIPRYAS